MTQEFSTNINPNLSIHTILIENEGWEIHFKGPQAEKELGEYQMILMWDEQLDPEGKHAKKVHDQAVTLLTNKTPLEKVHLEISALIEQICDELDVEIEESQ